MLNIINAFKLQLFPFKNIVFVKSLFSAVCHSTRCYLPSEFHFFSPLSCFWLDWVSTQLKVYSQTAFFIQDV